MGELQIVKSDEAVWCCDTRGTVLHACPLVNRRVRQFGSLLNIADILERELNPVIHDWLSLVEKQENPMSIKLSYEDRTGHLPVLFREVIARLEVFNPTHVCPVFYFAQPQPCLSKKL